MAFGYIGAETAYFGKYAATGGQKPGYTRTINYGPGGNPNYAGPRIGTGVNPAASGAINRAIDYYKEGGGFGKGTEAALARGETKAVASGTQGLVSAGLAGTSMMAGLGKKYQEEVAAPMRARVEETRAQAISGLEITKAQIIQGATESARASALQQYLAELQSGPGTQGPTVTARPTAAQPAAATPAATPYADVGYSSIVGGSSKKKEASGVTGRSPVASYWDQSNVTGAI